MSPPSAALPPALADGVFDAVLFDAVLFDLDGTLIDSTASVRRSWLDWARELDVDPARLLGWHGVPARTIVEALLPAAAAPRGLARIEALEVADAQGIIVLAGATAALSALPPGRAAIVTSCTRPLAAARIRATGLHAPHVVVVADDVPVGKPHPAPYLLGAALLGFEPGRCLVVEDAPAGLESARAAGCATLALTTTHAAHELVADAVVADLAEVRFSAGKDGVRLQLAGGAG